ncbi:hypothetical protein, partial [Micromonospora sp. ATA51]|uniref:hypothetical protein n=1 Tax=Micromonospora sp. ATA51 TaxID=2806098 RepID=UPI001A5A8F4E
MPTPLRAGGRKGLLQPYLDLLKQLTLGIDELARHRQELTGLLTAPMSTVADYAYTSLQTLHRTSELDRATLAEITQGMLSRPEKKLVRAHLAWLRKLPLEHLVDGLVGGLHHPVPELAERTVDLIEARLPTLSEASRERLKAEDSKIVHQVPPCRRGQARTSRVPTVTFRDPRGPF